MVNSIDHGFLEEDNEDWFIDNACQINMTLSAHKLPVIS